VPVDLVGGEDVNKSIHPFPEDQISSISGGNLVFGVWIATFIDLFAIATRLIVYFL
jgi:hypothetical protein